MKHPAVFFDRDGVLNVDRDYVHRSEDFEWMPGAKAAIRFCNDAGVLVFVVTNQAGVARGLYREDAVHALHAFMAEDLAASGAHIDAFAYCPHHPEATVAAYRRTCRCRKPGPGMIEDLLAAWPVDKSRSFLVGDKATDIGAAIAAGIPGYLYTHGSLLDQVKNWLHTAE